MSNDSVPVVVHARKIEREKRDVAHKILPHAGYTDMGWNSEDDAPIGSYVMYGTRLTDEQIQEFTGSSNCILVETDEVATADSLDDRLNESTDSWNGIPEMDVLKWMEAEDAFMQGYDGTGVLVAILDGGIPPEVRKRMNFNVIETVNFSGVEVGPDGHTNTHGAMVAPPGVPPGSLVGDYVIGDNEGRSMSSAFAAACRRAVDKARELGLPVVINYSYSGSLPNETQRAALRYVRDYGGLVVASAGNDSRIGYIGAPALLSREFPGTMHSSIAFDHRTTKRAGFSNCAADGTFCAPGLRVLSLNEKAEAKPVSGTSFSSPLGGYLLALLMSRGRFSAAVVSKAYRDTAIKMVDVPDIEQGFGRWSFKAALVSLLPVSPPVPPVRPVPPVPSPAPDPPVEPVPTPVGKWWEHLIATVSRFIADFLSRKK